MADKPKKQETPILDPVPNQQIEEAARREEPKLLSLVFKDKDVLEELVSGGVSVHHFQTPIQRDLFSLAARYFDKYGTLLTRQSIESIAVGNFSDEQAAKLRSEFDATYAEIVSPNDFGILKENLLGRQVQKQAFHVIQKYYDSLLKKTSGQRQLVEKLQNEIAQIRLSGGNTFNKMVSLSDMLRDVVMPEIEDRRVNPEKYWGVMSGFSCLDNVYHGFVKGRYMVLLAMEGGGKTTMMFNMARNMAVMGYNVVYVTIESNAKDTSTRLLTIHAAVNYNRIIAGGDDSEYGLSTFIMDELHKAGKDLIEGPGTKFHWVQVLQGTPRKEIFSLINRKRAYMDVDAVFVDYLDVVGRDVSYPNRPDLEVADVSSGLQSWGRENTVLVVTAQQLKTETGKKLYDKPEKASEMRVGVSDTSGSKKIAGAADYIFSILIDQETMDRIWLWSTKARQGASSKRHCLSYDPDSGRIKDVPGDEDTEEVEKRVRAKIREKTNPKPAPPEKGLETPPEHGKEAPKPPESVETPKNDPVEPQEASQEPVKLQEAPKTPEVPVEPITPPQPVPEPSKASSNEFIIADTPPMDEGFAGGTESTEIF
jgi:replicative DNA helicase